MHLQIEEVNMKIRRKFLKKFKTLLVLPYWRWNFREVPPQTRKVGMACAPVNELVSRQTGKKRLETQIKNCTIYVIKSFGKYILQFNNCTYTTIRYYINSILGIESHHRRKDVSRELTVAEMHRHYTAEPFAANKSVANYETPTYSILNST